MGVLGLWQLLAPVGQPVTLESLENKIFAVDISIWLNQAIKGYRDSQGGSVPNAHLLSLFSRLCKLLFYKIRPIIVFDGGFPELKKQTIINRQQRRAAVKQNSRDFSLKILSNYVASQQLGSNSNGLNFKSSIRTKEKPREEIFKLPPLPESSQTILSDSFNEDYERKFTNFSREDIRYLNQIDLESSDFNALPLDVKQEILSTLKESRKHSSWDQFNDLPRESNEFSNYQMQCLLKKRKLQSKLEQVQKDMRQVNSSAYVSQYTNDHVIGETNKIMSDDTSYYVLLKKIPKHSEEHSKSSEDTKPATSVMADTKSAFIKDIKEIDFQEDDFLSDSDSNSNNCAQTVNIKSEVDACKVSDRDDDVQVLENETGQAVPKIKTEVHSLDLSDEDVDNPPLLEEPPRETDQNVGKNTEVSHTDNNLHSTSDVPMQTMLRKNGDSSELKADEETVLPNAENVFRSENQAELKGNEENVLPNTENVFRSAKQGPVASSSAEGNAEQSEMNQNVLVDAPVEKQIKKPLFETMITAGGDFESNVENRVNEGESPSYDKTGTSFDDAHPFDNTPDNEASLEHLRSDTAALEAEQAKMDRQSRTVQDHMVEECKELLRLFGIPYVVSPLEAEAQCAFYDSIDFTHGTITEDSDVWLFGGKRVYKNFFTQQKFVECYKDKEIFSHFRLSREKFIHFALLTGSDYTEGIEGVGPVTAMEIISEFPGEGIDALQKFKDWWLDSNKSKRPPENKVRAKLLKLVLAENFPDEKVYEAYLHPEVDSSKEKFTWGRPDLDAIRDYAKERFGWNQSKVDSSLLPVLQKLNERDRQTHLDSFFTVTLRKEKNLFPSKRIMSALKKITSPQKEEAEINERTSAPKRKSKSSGKKTVPKKTVRRAVSNKMSGKNITSRGPNLSEESSSDDES